MIGLLASVLPTLALEDLYFANYHKNAHFVGTSIISNFTGNFE